MKFEVLSEVEFDTFASNHEQSNFMQTSMMAKMRTNYGWQKHYLGVKKDNHIIMAGLFLSKKRKFNKYEFYSPHGFLGDYHNQDVLAFFTDNLKKYIKKNKGYILIIEPYIIKQERDIDGNILENGKNNLDVIKVMKTLGYNYLDSSEQTKWMFCLDTNKDEETIFKNMRQNTRNLINRSLKNCLYIEELSYNNLDLFKKISLNTSERRNFSDKPLSYYQNMFNSFKDNLKYLVVKMDLKSYLDTLNREYSDVTNKINNTEDNNKNKGKLKELNVTKDSLMKKIDECKNLLKDNDNIVLGGSMFITYGNEVIYLISGNYKEYMHFNGPYFLQWHMIKYAIKNGYKRYNFYGISGNFDKSDDRYGVYEFKKGFNGYVEELIGSFVLPISPIYYLYKFIDKIKKSGNS